MDACACLDPGERLRQSSRDARCRSGLWPLRLVDRRLGGLCVRLARGCSQVELAQLPYLMLIVLTGPRRALPGPVVGEPSGGVSCVLLSAMV